MIVRVSKRERFVTIDKTGIEDSRLSFKATGLLAYLLSKPDDWTINSRGLTEAKTDQRSAILSGLRELEKAGYLSREQRRVDSGAFEWEQVLYETPVDFQHDHGAKSDPWSEQGKQRETAGGHHGSVIRTRETAPGTKEGSTDKPSASRLKTEPDPNCPDCGGKSWTCFRCTNYGKRETA